VQHCSSVRLPFIRPAPALLQPRHQPTQLDMRLRLRVLDCLPAYLSCWMLILSRLAAEAHSRRSADTELSVQYFVGRCSKVKAQTAALATRQDHLVQHCSSVRLPFIRPAPALLQPSNVCHRHPRLSVVHFCSSPGDHHHQLLHLAHIRRLPPHRLLRPHCQRPFRLRRCRRLARLL